MIARTVKLALLLAGLAVAALPSTARAASFTPQQRDEIVAILRDALKTDPSILRDAVIALQTDDARHQNEAQESAITAAAPALFHTNGDPTAGNPNGRVTLVEFYDVRCPYCRRMLPTLATLLHNNPDVRLVYKDMPVLGPGSVIGSRALLAAQKQGGYQKLHDALMIGTPDITEATVKTAAQKAGLDWTRLQTDMDAPDVQTRISNNLALARQLQLQGTPVYIVGSTLMPGAVDLADLQDAVTRARAAP